MRGKGRHGVQGQSPCRITPAYAGKSVCAPVCACPMWDHPRVCGEKLVHFGQGGGLEGSPPRMRGKVLAALMPTNALGITPAYAGKSAQEEMQMGVKRDHPRVCGEKRLVKRRARCLGGSPPRMRGKGCHCWITPQLVGITPAYAGKSQPFCPKLCKNWDHPRVCGEKFYYTTPARGFQGSPPRMRGKAGDTFQVDTTARITPAYAGKSIEQGRNANHG